MPALFVQTSMSKCDRCGGIVRKSPDPAFCVKCIHQMDNLMDNARGVGALLGRKEASQAQKAFAFLGIFHPKMTHAQKRGIVGVIEEKERNEERIWRR